MVIPDTPPSDLDGEAARTSSVPCCEIPDPGRGAVRNALFIGLTRAGQIVLALVSIGMISRYLGVPGFGAYSLIWACTSLLAAIPAAGLNNILVRETARDRSLTPKYLGAAIGIRAVLSLLILVGLATVLAVVRPRTDLLLTLLFAYAWVIGQLSIDICGAVFLAYEKMQYDLLVTLSNSLLTVLCLAGVIHLDGGMPGIYAATAATNWIAAQIGWQIVIRKFARPEMALDTPFWRRYLSEALPVGTSRVLKEVYSRLDVFLLAWMSTSLNVGLFNGAYRIVVQANGLPIMLVRAVYPALSRSAGVSTERLIATAGKCLSFLLVLAFPIAVFLTVLAQQIIVLVLGREFAQAYAGLMVLGWVTLTMFPDTLFFFLLIAANRQKYNVFSLAVCVLVNLVADLLLIPPLGFMGACVGTFLAELAFLTASYVCVRKFVGPLRLSVNLLKVGLATITMGGALLLVRDGPLLVSIPLGIVVYVGLLVLLRVFDRGEIVDLLRSLRPQQETLSPHPIQIVRNHESI